MGSSLKEKIASGEQIVAIAEGRIRRDGIDELRVADVMDEAGLARAASTDTSIPDLISFPRLSPLALAEGSVVERSGAPSLFGAAFRFLNR
jgi:hypothetical protein